MSTRTAELLAGIGLLIFSLAQVFPRALLRVLVAERVLVGPRAAFHPWGTTI